MLSAVYEENPASHICSWKKYSVFKVFSDNFMYMYKFLIQPQNSTSFLLKSISLSHTSNKSLPVHDLVTSGIGHLKNTSSLGYAGLPNAGI